MRRATTALLAGALTLVLPARVHAQSAYHAVQAIDARVQSIGWQLASANAAYCAQRQPAIGLLLQDIQAYDNPQEARLALGLSPSEAGDIAIQAVAAGSPAQRSGLQPNLPVLAIAGQDTKSLAPGRHGYDREATLRDLLDSALARDGAVDLLVGTHAQNSTVHIVGHVTCPARFEVLLENSVRAAADGERVVVSRGFIARLGSDEELAVVLAHELAHNLLGHRAELDAKGRSIPQVRTREIEADRLSVWLLANANFDPHIAARFWETIGRRLYRGILLSPTHLRWRSRYDLIQAEIAAMPATLDENGRRDWRVAFAP